MTASYPGGTGSGQTGPDSDPPKRNYFVPHFGDDSDILAAKKNIADAEAGLGHQMEASFDADGKG